MAVGRSGKRAEQRRAPGGLPAAGYRGNHRHRQCGCRHERPGSAWGPAAALAAAAPWIWRSDAARPCPAAHQVPPGAPSTPLTDIVPSCRHRSAPCARRGRGPFSLPLLFRGTHVTPPRRQCARVCIVTDRRCRIIINIGYGVAGVPVRRPMRCRPTPQTDLCGHGPNTAPPIVETCRKGRSIHHALHHRVASRRPRPCADPDLAVHALTRRLPEPSQ
jgi:hypothetical protein